VVILAGPVVTRHDGRSDRHRGLPDDESSAGGDATGACRLELCAMRVVTMMEPRTERQARRFLSRLGCRRSLWASTREKLVIGFFVGAALVAVISLTQDASSVFATWKLTDFIPLAALVTLMQWRATVEQNATESYQKNIEGANTKTENTFESVMLLMPNHYRWIGSASADRREFEQAHYVYRALDDLEFMLEKYMLGFASGFTTTRQVMTFKSKCDSAAFLSRAERAIRDAWYSPVTKKVFARLASRLQSSQELDEPNVVIF
jgi:hypothetical protein